MQCTPLKLYSGEKTAVIPRQMIALELAAGVVVSLLALGAYERLGTSAKQQFELSEVLEPYLALKAFVRLLISITLLNHLCAQHSFVG